MTEELHDPNLPAGEIVEKREDGTWVRNDGVELRPATENVFYVMATIEGEQGERYNGELAAKNRRYWNGWACAGMSSEARAKLAERLGLDLGELEPLTKAEQDKVKVEIKARMGTDATRPDPANVGFSKTYFSNTVLFEKFIFAGPAYFSSAHFARDADFSSAHFAGPAYFPSAHFVLDADFSSAHFAGYANFPSAHFAWDANFPSAHFARDADFSSAHFVRYADFSSGHFVRDADFSSGHFAGFADFSSTHFAWDANFQSAHFAGPVGFSDRAFEGVTDFRQAQFETRVPDFFQRSFHDNTKFTSEADNWPKPDPERAQNDKDAYRRLRQVSAEQQNPENEHFFLRQEMACNGVDPQKDWISRTVVRGFGWVSDYGYSLWRPLVGLAATWGLGALMILGVFAWAFVYGTPPEGMAKVPTMFEAFGLGFANTVSIFGFRGFYFPEGYMASLPVVVKIIGGTQTILGFVFLFFLGLGLRNRFRLR